MIDNNLFADMNKKNRHTPEWVRRHAPSCIKRALIRVFWLYKDFYDFTAEAIGWIPFHFVRWFFYKYVFGIRIGDHSSIHRNCRIYYPKGVSIGSNSVVNRDVLLDGRMGLAIGSNVSISEGCLLLSLEHDPASPSFAEKGGTVIIADYVFIGARAMILPEVTVGKGSVVAAGAIVTKNVNPYTIVAGIPAHPIGKRTEILDYILDYHKFLG